MFLFQKIKPSLPYITKASTLVNQNQIINLAIKMQTQELNKIWLNNFNNNYYYLLSAQMLPQVVFLPLSTLGFGMSVMAGPYGPLASLTQIGLTHGLSAYISYLTYTQSTTTQDAIIGTACSYLPFVSLGLFLYFNKPK